MSHFVLELFFDVDTEQSIRCLWEQADAMPGWTPSARGYARPHISIASTSIVDTNTFDPILKDVVALTPPLPITFSSVATFPSDEGVVFLAPVVTANLLFLHERLYEALRQSGALIANWYSPGQWVPHCTVAHGLPSGRVPHVIELCLKGPLPLVGHVEQIALVEVPTNQHDAAKYLSLTGVEVKQRSS